MHLDGSHISTGIDNGDETAEELRILSDRNHMSGSACITSRSAAIPEVIADPCPGRMDTTIVVVNFDGT